MDTCLSVDCTVTVSFMLVYCVKVGAMALLIPLAAWLWNWLFDNDREGY